MGPNDTEIVQVYTREQGSTVESFTLTQGQPAEVVIEVAAGSAIFSTGAKYQIGLAVMDLISSTPIPVTPVPPATAPTTGSLSDPSWSTEATRFVYTIAAGDLVPPEGHFCKVYAYLIVGVNPANYDASFVESPPFVVLP